MTERPTWADARGNVPQGIEGPLLSDRQRDFLASYPDECIVVIEEQDAETGTLCVWADKEMGNIEQRFELPWEGFISQPGVTLDDPEAELDSLPETYERD